MQRPKAGGNPEEKKMEDQITVKLKIQIWKE